MRYEKRRSVVARRIAGEMVLVPIRQRAGEVASLFALNEVAARAWELLDDAPTLPELVEAIVGEFEVSADVAGADLAELLDQLVEIGALGAVDGESSSQR